MLAQPFNRARVIQAAGCFFIGVFVALGNFPELLLVCPAVFRALGSRSWAVRICKTFALALAVKAADTVFAVAIPAATFRALAVVTDLAKGPHDLAVSV